MLVRAPPLCNPSRRGRLRAITEDSTSIQFRNHCDLRADASSGTTAANRPRRRLDRPCPERLTALNFDPSMATLAMLNRSSLRHSTMKLSAHLANRWSVVFAEVGDGLEVGCELVDALIPGRRHHLTAVLLTPRPTRGGQHCHNIESL